MLAPARSDMPWIHWHGWREEGNIACIVLASPVNATVWSNRRIVTGRRRLLVDLWARYVIAHGSVFQILYAHELDVIAD